eukprot:GHVU01192517.1.p1 GENE.GHVU01192517.1~~GHVU01192517.1.p1  ORF type:complete len:108 (+),score=7.88 GHVU01192517.1:235-558(+)
METVYKYIQSIQDVSTVQQLFQSGHLAVFANTASLLVSEKDLDFYYMCMCTGGHPGMAPTKATFKATFGASVITVFPFHICIESHAVLFIFHVAEERLWGWTQCQVK